MKSLLVSAMLAIALTGCASLMGPTPPTKEQETSADYGVVSIPQAEQLIRAHLNATLIDPYSYHLDVFSSSKRHWAKDKQGAYHFGWGIGYQVNAKNQMGGYTGNKRYIAFIEKGQIIQIYNVFDSGDGCYPDFHTIQTM